MNNPLKCYISANADVDISTIKSILQKNHIEVFDLFDFAVGESIQQILKKKLRQADFAIFVISKNSGNVLYEMGVCEGLGKKALVIIDKETEVPFYLNSQLSFTANLKEQDFLEIALLGFIERITSKRKPTKSHQSIIERETYNKDTINLLKSYLHQVQNIRTNGQGRDLDPVLINLFKSINSKYADNTHRHDMGIDYALWNDKLGRVLGNPIIVEAKFGNLSQETFKKAEVQIQKYVGVSDAKIALLLYLDRSGKRFELDRLVAHPLIITYDIEDFITDLLESSFEDVILKKRNEIIHGR
jgi:hypothetical protein